MEQEIQQKLFDGADIQDPGPRRQSWDPSLTRRMRVLLHALPILNLKRSDSMRDPELQHYDSLVLAMKSIDLIIENMGLGQEVDYKVLLRELYFERNQLCNLKESYLYL